jgi:hypothetical protein
MTSITFDEEGHFDFHYFSVEEDINSIDFMDDGFASVIDYKEKVSIHNSFHINDDVSVNSVDTYLSNVFSEYINVNHKLDKTFDNDFKTKNIKMVEVVKNNVAYDTKAQKKNRIYENDKKNSNAEFLLDECLPTEIDFNEENNEDIELLNKLHDEVSKLIHGL